MTARPLVLALAALIVAAAACGSQGDGGPVLDPGDPSGAGPIATELLRAQNDVRAGAQPPPSPALPALQWSPSAAATAQAWADGCRFDHNPARGALGENIAAGAGGYFTPTGIVGLWAAEAPFYDLAANTCDTTTPANGAGTCGHYTQLVWRDTLRVGCGWRTCTTGGPFGGGSWDFWVCDYEPAGNVAGQRPY